MENKKNTISACLVVYNEEKVIEKCLASIKNLVDEIIVVHDGECNDNTLEIAKKYTDKIFVREHAGIMEAHLVFAYEQTSSEWILRIDADEYFDEVNLPKIKDSINNENINLYKFKWEMWNGFKSVYFNGLSKECLFRKKDYHFCGIPHSSGWSDGEKGNLDIFLHHRPAYNNIVWTSFFKKMKKWVPIHAKYFFSDLVNYDCFQVDNDVWKLKTEKIKKYLFFYIIFEPFKNFVGQIKNGLWKSWTGFNIALQQYVYYTVLYWKVWKIKKRKK